MGRDGSGAGTRRWPASARRGVSWSLSGLAGVLLAAACAALPPAHATPDIRTVVLDGSVRRTSIDLRQEASVGELSLTQSPREVWLVLPAVFDQLGIDVTTRDVSGGVMGNTGFHTRRIEGHRMSRYLNCGSGLTTAYADQYDVTVAVLVRLARTEEGVTLLRTSLDAFAKDRAVSGNSIHCTSYGTLEQRIASLVTEKVEG